MRRILSYVRREPRQQPEGEAPQTTGAPSGPQRTAPADIPRAPPPRNRLVRRQRDELPQPSQATSRLRAFFRNLGPGQARGDDGAAEEDADLVDALLPPIESGAGYDDDSAAESALAPGEDGSEFEFREVIPRGFWEDDGVPDPLLGIGVETAQAAEPEREPERGRTGESSQRSTDSSLPAGEPVTRAPRDRSAARLESRRQFIAKQRAGRPKGLGAIADPLRRVARMSDSSALAAVDRARLRARVRSGDVAEPEDVFGPEFEEGLLPAIEEDDPVTTAVGTRPLPSLDEQREQLRAGLVPQRRTVPEPSAERPSRSSSAPLSRGSSTRMTADRIDIYARAMHLAREAGRATSFTPARQAELDSMAPALEALYRSRVTLGDSKGAAVLLSVVLMPMLVRQGRLDEAQHLLRDLAALEPLSLDQLSQGVQRAARRDRQRGLNRLKQRLQAVTLRHTAEAALHVARGNLPDAVSRLDAAISAEYALDDPDLSGHVVRARLALDGAVRARDSIELSRDGIAPLPPISSIRLRLRLGESLIGLSSNERRRATSHHLAEARQHLSVASRLIVLQGRTDPRINGASIRCLEIGANIAAASGQWGEAARLFHCIRNRRLSLPMPPRSEEERQADQANIGKVLDKIELEHLGAIAAPEYEERADDGTPQLHTWAGEPVV
jgi:hypothetical protein